MGKCGKQPFISAFIICMNEEERIAAALDSVKWCDEIVVVDSGSTDRTVEICSEYTDRVFERDWPGYVAQKQFALEQCRGEWVLCVDADEVVSPELCNNIRLVVAADKDNRSNINGYWVSRVVFFLDRWWSRGGWYPEHKLRLMRRSMTTWGGADPHEHPLVEGKIGRLDGDLLHYTYNNMQCEINTLNKFSSIAAEMMHKRGKKFALRNLFFNPLARFLKFFLIKRGFREGLAGFMVAVTEAYFVFLKYAKLWEIEHNKKGK